MVSDEGPERVGTYLDDLLERLGNYGTAGSGNDPTIPLAEERDPTDEELARFAPRSPLHPQALHRDDLRVGMGLRLCHTAGEGNTISGVVVSEPYSDRTLPEAKVIKLRRVIRAVPIEEEHFLTDLGLLPDPHDGWNPVNYCLAEPSLDTDVT